VDQEPIMRTSQAQWVTMSLLRLAQFRLEAEGEVDWWFRRPGTRRRTARACWTWSDSSAVIARRFSNICRIGWEQRWKWREGSCLS